MKIEVREGEREMETVGFYCQCQRGGEKGNFSFFLEVMTGNMTSTFHQKGKNNFRPFWSETGCYFWNPAGYLVADDVAITQSRLRGGQRERMPKVNDGKTKLQGKREKHPDLI